MRSKHSLQSLHSDRHAPKQVYFRPVFRKRFASARNSELPKAGFVLISFVARMKAAGRNPGQCEHHDSS